MSRFPSFLLLCAALLAMPAQGEGAAGAGRHSLQVYVANNGQTFIRTVAMTEGEEAVFSEEMRGRRFDFTGALTADGGRLRLYYRIGIAGGAYPMERSLDADGALFISPGGRLTAIKCAPWTVTFILDKKKGKRIKELDTARGLSALGNYRVAADLGKEDRRNCRILSAPGEESGLLDYMELEDLRRGFSLWVTLDPDAEDGMCSLGYRFENSFLGESAREESGGSLLLSPGRRAKAPLAKKGEEPSFYVEGGKAKKSR